MRPRILTVFLVLYALGALAFAIWTGLGLLRPDDATFALPLPAPAMLLAAAVNAAMAFGIARRVRVVRVLAITLHGLVTATAVVFFVLHVTGTRPATGDHPYVELTGKVAVHAIVTLLWWRHRGIAAWFAR